MMALCPPFSGYISSYFFHTLWITLWKEAYKLCISVQVFHTHLPERILSTVTMQHLGGIFVDKQGAAQIWSLAADALKAENPVAFDSWFKSLTAVDFDGKVLSLLVDNLFTRNILMQNYLTQLNTLLSRIAGFDITCALLIPSDLETPQEPKPQPAAPAAAPASPLNPRYTFSSYVIGNNNAMAHAAARKVAQNPGEAYNPLFLYSGVGLGKTHLMHAIGHEILEKNPNAKIMYITSETFTVELIQAIATNTNFEFRNRYRNVDVLMVDDIQFIAGKEATQEEFFHTFNALHQAGKQIIISSDKPPQNIPTLEERLSSRFQWGLTVDIAKPDLETRIAILRKKVERDHLDVPDEVNNFIATKVESNIRELEGCLNRVLAYANLTHSPISESLAAEALRDIITIKDPKRITTDLIMAMVADHFHVTVDDLKSKRRNREVSVPRQIAMYLVREMNGTSLPTIGEEFGGKDHTTVIHACKKIEDDLKHDLQLKETINTLKKRIQGA